MTSAFRAGRDQWDKICASLRDLSGDVARNLWSRFAPAPFREALPA